MKSAQILRLALLLAGLVAMPSRAPHAEEIAVAQYGNTTSAMPWAVALAKGYFKDAGVDITAIRASSGGSADIRAMIAGRLLYAESAPGAVITAVQNGADVRIVSENVHTNANDVWVTMPNSPIRTLADIKGKRLAYTTPQSTSELLDHLLVAKAGLQNNDVKYVASGPFAAELTALQTGGADIASIAEPLYTMNKDKYRVFAWARDTVDPFPATVGVVPTEMTKSRPNDIRAVLVARRRAVAFMIENRQESADIIGRVYKLDPVIVRSVIDGLIDNPSTGNVPYYGFGDFRPEGMDRLIAGLKLINALDSNIGWRTLVDQSFLPEDLRRPL